MTTVMQYDFEKLLRAANALLPTKTVLAKTIWLKSESVYVRGQGRTTEKVVSPFFVGVTLEAHSSGRLTAAVHMYTEQWIAYVSVPFSIKAQVNQPFRVTIYGDAILALVKLYKKSDRLTLSIGDQDKRLVMQLGRNIDRFKSIEQNTFYDRAYEEATQVVEQPATPIETPATMLMLSAPAQPLSCAVCGQESAVTFTHQQKDVCPDCVERIEAYTQKVQARADRLYRHAAKVSSEASATLSRTRTMAQAIPFGQPILVGHHSERRDRNYRDKIERGFRKAFERQGYAQHLTQRAEAAENNHAISSDNPAVILLLQTKLAKLQADQEQMKKVNAAVRQLTKKNPIPKHPGMSRGGTMQEMNDAHRTYQAACKAVTDSYPTLAPELARLAGISEKTALAVLTPDYAGRIGIPSYALTNNNATIRNVQKRIDELEAQRTTVAETAKVSVYGDIKIERSAEDNRLRLKFPGKPSADIIKLLKSSGFHWSAYNMAWQRQLNANAEYAAQQIIQTVNRKD